MWSSDGMELNRTDNISSTTVDNSFVYTDSFAISQLSTDDEGRDYWCEVVINSDPTVANNTNVTLDVSGK